MNKEAIKTVTTFKHIVSILEDKSEAISDYMMANNGSEFRLFYKTIKHSDLPTYAKRTDKKNGLDKNILYYLSFSEMEQIEKNSDKPFEVAKQSNIGVSTSFFEYIGVDQLQRRVGPQSNQHNHILLNDFINVYLVNDSLVYFDCSYTRKIIEKLGKKCKPKHYEVLNLSKNDSFTELDLRHAIHGLGTSQDEEFHKLRANIFKNDVIYLLVEKNEHRKTNLFILLDKNPAFFTILGLSNKRWEQYKHKKNQSVSSELYINELNLGTYHYENRDQSLQTTIGREFQYKWRNALALEMMNYTSQDDMVFCPFTYISANYEDVGTLFRASHIKEFAACSEQEKYDINNGLLLTANADALFDKHLISISEDKKLLFSFLLDENHKLKSELKLFHDRVFEMILNNERMKYVEHHRETFKRKEQERMMM